MQVVKDGRGDAAGRAVTRGAWLGRRGRSERSRRRRKHGAGEVSPAARGHFAPGGQGHARAGMDRCGRAAPLRLRRSSVRPPRGRRFFVLVVHMHLHLYSDGRATGHGAVRLERLRRSPGAMRRRDERQKRASLAASLRRWYAPVDA